MYRLFFVFIFCAIVSLGQTQTEGQIAGIEVSGTEISHLLELSSNYLVRHTDEGGKFEYRLNINPKVVVKPKYNLLRHAGTIYALTSYYKFSGDKAARDAAFRAGYFLLQEAIRPVADGHEWYGVWSDPRLNHSTAPSQIKLGGNGLGLVALLSLEAIEPGFVPAEILEGLGSFCLAMQKDDGSYYSKYIPSLGGMQDNWVSLYYPGEAALGLTMLYEYDGDIRWLNGANKTLEYLSFSRKGKSTVPADHWALLATERILKHKDTREISISQALLVEHTKQICTAIIRDQIGEDWPEVLRGGFSKDGRITPTATRLEGLIAALNIIPREDEIYSQIETSVDKGIEFLMRGVIREGYFTGGVPRAIGLLPGKSEDVEKFNARATEIRIDYVQHVMSAFITHIKQNSRSDR